MTDTYTVAGGRLVVDRVEGKESIDLDLSTVNDVSFTKGARRDLDGAVVLTTDEREYVVKVPNEDGPVAVAAIRDGLTADEDPDLLDLAEEAEYDKDHE